MSQSLDGDCQKYKKKFFIRINRDLPENVAIDTLIHEWAHARAWNHLLDSMNEDERFEDFSHDATWGVAYSEVYRIYQKLVSESYVPSEDLQNNRSICKKFRNS